MYVGGWCNNAPGSISKSPSQCITLPGHYYIKLIVLVNSPKSSKLIRTCTRFQLINNIIVKNINQALIELHVHSCPSKHLWNLL